MKAKLLHFATGAGIVIGFNALTYLVNNVASLGLDPNLTAIISTVAGLLANDLKSMMATEKAQTTANTAKAIATSNTAIIEAHTNEPS